MNTPHLISGNCHTDERGQLFFNNNFDASKISRMYIIENATTEIIRAWQGHKIEKRWFSVIQGRFKIQLIEIDDWEKPDVSSKKNEFVLDSTSLNILHVPSGYVSSIQALEDRSKLLVMADYRLGEIDDEYRFDQEYFIK